MKITTKLKGTKKDGYVLEIRNSQEDFCVDIALTHDELVSVKELLNKKIK